MTTTSAPYDTGVLLDPTHLSEVLKSFPKHRSAMAPRLQEYLLVERLEGLHGEQLLDIAGVCWRLRWRSTHLAAVSTCCSSTILG